MSGIKTLINAGYNPVIALRIFNPTVPGLSVMGTMPRAIYFVIRQSFPSQNIIKDLDQSCKTNLDL